MKSIRDSTSAMSRMLSTNSPPLSPTRTQIQSRPLTSSKVLAALDAELLISSSEPLSPLLPRPALNLRAPAMSSIQPNHASRASLRTVTANVVGSTTSTVSMTTTADVVAGNVNVIKNAAGKSKTTTKTAESELEKNFPLYRYKDYTPTPCIVYTRNEDEANDFIQLLKGPLGFDMEWCANGKYVRRTALVQFSDEKIILLVQISAMSRFPQKVKEVIESPSIIKMGANIHNDGRKLYNDFGIVPKALLELGAFAQKADPKFKETFNRKIVSLAKVVAFYEKKTLAKGRVRTSNWELELSQEQQEYSASDAHCALMVYKRIMKIAELDERVLKPLEAATDFNPTYTPPPLANRDDSGSTATTSSSTSTSIATILPDEGRTMRPQAMRAYNLWHYKEMPLHEICARLRSAENPLKESTVISYVINALQADPTLPYSITKLKELVQMETGSWQRHRDWIIRQEHQIEQQQNSH